MSIKVHQEHNLKKMSDANLEKLAKTLGLTLIVAENGKEPVIEAILAAELKLVTEEGLEGAAGDPSDSGDAPDVNTGADEQDDEEDKEAEPKRAVVIFPEIDEEDERTSEVRLSVNGRTIRCKRGVEVSIPIEHYHGSLLLAVETRYIPRKKMIDGMPSTVEKQVPRFPHQFIKYEY